MPARRLSIQTLSRILVAFVLTTVCIVFILASVVSGTRPPVDPLKWSSWSVWYLSDPRSAIGLIFAAIGAPIGVAIGVYQVFFDKKLDREAAAIKSRIAIADEQSAGRDALTASTLEEVKSLLKQASYPSYITLGNVGIVVNARGKLCVVHDQQVLTAPAIFLYNAHTRKLNLIFINDSNILFSWGATEEIHKLLISHDNMLLVQMQDKIPVRGYSTSLISFSGEMDIQDESKSIIAVPTTH